MGKSQERRPCRESDATWTGPLSEAMPACRGRRADHAQKDRVGTWEIPRSARAIPLLVRIGKGKPIADDERTREVGPSSSSYEAGEQGGAIRRWDQGECEPAAHGPDAEPGNLVTGAGAHTSNRTAICRHSPEVGAVCGKAARTDLCGGGSNLRPYRDRHHSHPGRLLWPIPACGTVHIPARSQHLSPLGKQYVSSLRLLPSCGGRLPGNINKFL